MSFSDDEGYDYDYSEDEGGDEYKEEVKVGERVGVGNLLLGRKATTRAEKAMLTPLERFRQAVDAIARGLNSTESISISEESIAYLIDKAENISVIEHKNPTGYVLGFLASDGGISLTRENFNRVITRALPNVEDKSVLPPDVIRYARMWMNMT